MISSVAALKRRNVPADGVQDGRGHGAPQVAPFEEAPEGVAGHAEVLGCLPPSMPPHVGAHVVPDRLLEVRPGLRRAVQRLRLWLCDDQSTTPSAMSQHLIVKGKVVECNALQAIVLEAVLW